MAGKGDARRETLVAAAAVAFWERGYAATSLADVAHSAEVPVGTVFYYFKTKAALALAVADVFVSETETLIAEAAGSSEEPRQRIRYLLQRLGQSSRSRMEKGCPISAAIRDFRKPAPKASQRAAESFERLIGFMARELQKIGLRPSLALARARAITAEWQGGIALAHAFSDMTVLAESLRRTELALMQPVANRAE